jgi:hypothetical protein
MEIKLNVTLDEAKGIMAILGDLPTKAGAWPLLNKINEQIAEQLPKEETKD